MSTATETSYHVNQLRNVELLLDQMRAELRQAVEAKRTPEIDFSTSWPEPKAIDRLEKALMWIADTRYQLGDDEEVI